MSVPEPDPEPEPDPLQPLADMIHATGELIKHLMAQLGMGEHTMFDEQDTPEEIDPSAPSPEPSHGVGAQHTILEPEETADSDDGTDGADLADDENDEIDEDEKTDSPADA